MQFKDLLRASVLLMAATATVLGAVTVIAANALGDTLSLIVAAGWWLVAAAVGLALGRPERAAASMAGLLAGARTTTTLPGSTPGRIALSRLWPLGVFTLLAGGVGFVFPAVPAIGAGYALLVALAWRNREALVTAVEDRDGICFYVEPSSPVAPVRLIRTPGLYRDRMPSGHPAPPPPADSPGA